MKEAFDATLRLHLQTYSLDRFIGRDRSGSIVSALDSRALHASFLA